MIKTEQAKDEVMEATNDLSDVQDTLVKVFGKRSRLAARVQSIRNALRSELDYGASRGPHEAG